VARANCFLDEPSLERQVYLYVLELGHGFIFNFSSDNKECEIATKYGRELNGRAFVANY